EEDAAGGLEALAVEVAVWLTELHQVDAGEVAGRVVEEHVLAARIAGVDAAAVGAGVPAVDRGVVLGAGVGARPSALGQAIPYFAGRIGRAGLLRIGDPARGPIFVAFDGLHEVVGDANGEVGVLEHDRAVGFAVEVGFVAAFLDQTAGLLLFFPFALDE